MEDQGVDLNKLNDVRALIARSKVLEEYDRTHPLIEDLGVLVTLSEKRLEFEGERIDRQATMYTNLQAVRAYGASKGRTREEFEQLWKSEYITSYDAYALVPVGELIIEYHLDLGRLPQEMLVNDRDTLLTFVKRGLLGPNPIPKK
jgi:hypothetical protein